MQKKWLLTSFFIFFCLFLYIFIKLSSSNSKILGSNTKISPTKIPKITNTPTITPSFTPTPTATPSPTPSPTILPSPTATPTATPTVIAPANLEELFIKYSSEYSINNELLKKIANCESSFNQNAGNERYAGLFQFAQPIWIQTRNLMGQNSDVSLRFNAEESIRTAAFMLSQGHLGIWPNCSK